MNPSDICKIKMMSKNLFVGIRYFETGDHIRWRIVDKQESIISALNGNLPVFRAAVEYDPGDIIYVGDNLYKFGENQIFTAQAKPKMLEECEGSPCKIRPRKNED